MYSHDGIRDALTHLAAPTLLYEELRRELARATRGDLPVSLVRFVLASTGQHTLDMADSAYSRYQLVIINFAHSLTRLSRGEDVCARMGEREFVCILRGNANAAQIYVSRIVSSWREENSPTGDSVVDFSLRLGVASVVATSGENALELLNRLDLETLIPSEQT